jgi:diguanylate cyclase (GGDEF)-like protein
VSRERTLAGFSRLALGAYALVVVPLSHPASAGLLLVFGAYLTFAVGLLALAWRGVGWARRPLLAGLVDAVAITSLVHHVGSASTMMVSIYFYAVLVNTLLQGRRVGMVLAAVSAIAYAITLALESARVIAYAPGAVRPPLPPMPWEAATASLLLGLLLILSAGLVGYLVQQIRRREAELLDANAKLAELSVRDPLTGLHNRRFLMETLDKELARRRRGHPLAVIMLDLDGFKRVNDERSHEAGDDALVAIAEALSREVRTEDVVGRYGGDEFVVVLPDTELAPARAVAQRLVDAVWGLGRTFDPDRPITASVGIARAIADDAPRGVLRRADDRAYRAKNEGGDRVVFGDSIADAPSRGAEERAATDSWPAPSGRPG